MREILFRGKRKDNGEWVYGGYYTDGKKHFIITTVKHIPDTRDWDTAEYYEKNPTYLPDFKEVIPETIGQFTGLTDKNGKKIFDGDIVTMPAYAGGKHKAVVYFKNGKFAVDGSNYSFKDIAPKRMEVIGNKHDNPELLKEGTWQ